MIIASDAFLNTQGQRITELALSHQLPSITQQIDYASVGGLICYGVNTANLYRRAATYIDKILKGAKPGDMPIQVITRHSVIFNLRPARAIGVAIPPELLKQADQVIE